MRLCGSEVTCSTVIAILRGFINLECHGQNMKPHHTQNTIKTILPWAEVPLARESNAKYTHARTHCTFVAETYVHA